MRGRAASLISLREDLAMKNLGKSLTLVVGLLAAASAAASAIAACSTDTSVTTDGGSPEAAPIDGSVPDSTTVDTGTDAGVDQFVPVEAGSVAEFVTQNAAATCTRAKECCIAGGKATFREADCVNDLKNDGWNQSLQQITAAGVLDGGRISYDPVLGSQCLTAIRNITCGLAPAAEYRLAQQKCFAAVKGNQATSAPCVNSVECQSTMYCDPLAAGGTCVTLKANGADCTATNPTHDQCSYRGAGTSACLEPTVGAQKVCAPLLADGVACRVDFDCQSGACFPDTNGDFVCSPQVNFTEGVCDFYE